MGTKHKAADRAAQAHPGVIAVALSEESPESVAIYYQDPKTAGRPGRQLARYYLPSLAALNVETERKSRTLETTRNHLLTVPAALLRQKEGGQIDPSRLGLDIGMAVAALQGLPLFRREVNLIGAGGNEMRSQMEMHAGLTEKMLHRIVEIVTPRRDVPVASTVDALLTSEFPSPVDSRASAVMQILGYDESIGSTALTNALLHAVGRAPEGLLAEHEAVRSPVQTLD
jgi:hypothetical protein